MYEIINETETNYIYNSDIYTDNTIGEIDTGHEIDVYENDMYKIMICPCLNENHPLIVKMYKKDSEIFKICRLDYFGRRYIKSNYEKSFVPNNEEITLINESLHNEQLMERCIYWSNQQLMVLREDYSLFEGIIVDKNNLPQFEIKDL